MDRGPARRRPRPALRLVAGGLAAAAAIAAIGILVAPEGRVIEADLVLGAGPIVVDGREVSTRDLSVISAAVSRASALESRDAALELAWGDDLALLIRPHTVVDKLADDADGLRLALRSGEIYLKSKSSYGGPPVLVETDRVVMTMTGTVVGVLADEQRTCICVARGEVEVVCRTQEDGSVVCRSEARRVYADAGQEAARFEELEDHGGDHVADLKAFAEPGKRGF